MRLRTHRVDKVARRVLIRLYDARSNYSARWVINPAQKKKTVSGQAQGQKANFTNRVQLRREVE
jgi:hypothetical protein